MVLCLKSDKRKRLVKAKLVHVVRHGEAQHNIQDKYLLKRDTKLTERGRRQAKSLHTLLPKLKPEVAMTSAVLRALQTTRCMGFMGKTMVVPEAREVAGWPANDPIDTKRALAGNLESQFGKYDWSLVAKGSRQTGGNGGQGWERTVQIKDRARRLTRLIERRQESSILLVSHGEFLQHLTSDKYMQNCFPPATASIAKKRWVRLRA
ncbi:cobC [Symbiodinium pilosum]|uniref:CobC protein n=1 Tax=Symbiodinium pilosum TaxID=2952 RepID=A0A812V6B8_SYMPI|nr:cobC [Symbiodinium pilosum]